MKTITALELRKKLGSVLDSVATGRAPVCISRANKPLAVLISVQEYEEKIARTHRQERLESVAKEMDRWREQHKGMTRLNSVELVRMVRDGR